MDTFRRLLITAVLAGVIAGVFVTVVHQIATIPVILKAEVFEKAAETAPAVGNSATADGSAMSTTEHDHATGEAHEHDEGGWEPSDGLQRNAFTAAADILTGIGFALLLAAAYAARGTEMDWRKGLFWGLAGFAVFTLAPSLGLPPEVPGTEAAPLMQRQVWWVATVALTGGGLALIFLTRQILWSVLGVAMIVLPHAYGAPQPVEHHSAAPEALAHSFIVAATMTSLLFWVALGILTGFFFKRQFKAA
ncbi:CbtA family protein [Dongia soli]|uniref:CbtA family protein n=1 Tax=Dongia soli TaxID=600628 RepID=A0ABU5EHK8_9PROT|nr:CbtA family protein [Dongia soli]MDY0885792.1 CbtA family protein [Dongia soli]